VVHARGDSDKALLIGGPHRNSVPNGGLARRLPQRAGRCRSAERLLQPMEASVTVRLVNWADGRRAASAVRFSDRRRSRFHG